MQKIFINADFDNRLTHIVICIGQITGEIPGSMQPSSILSCQISSWYPLFGHLSFKSTVLDLPQDFVAFLVQDGVFFPEGSSAVRHTYIR